VWPGFSRHGMPPPASNPDLWPFDLETGTQVTSKVGNLPPKFGHTMPLGFQIIRYVRDGRTDRQSDRQTDESNAYYPLPYGREHNNSVCTVVHIYIGTYLPVFYWQYWFRRSRITTVCCTGHWWQHWRTQNCIYFMDTGIDVLILWQMFEWLTLSMTFQ